MTAARRTPPVSGAQQEPVALTFDAFRRANAARCVKWHPAGIASWSPSDWLTAVTGELGELASLLKMRNRERDGLPGNKFSPTQKQIAYELADVLTYLDLLAEALGVDLGKAAVEKFNEVSERVGFPDRITLSPPARQDAPCIHGVPFDKPCNDCVICPNCCHQFRAIPVNVQKELARQDAETQFRNKRGAQEQERCTSADSSTGACKTPSPGGGQPNSPDADTVALDLLRTLSGDLAERLALDMDHDCKDHSKWYRAVKRARAFLAQHDKEKGNG